MKLLVLNVRILIPTPRVQASLSKIVFSCLSWLGWPGRLGWVGAAAREDTDGHRFFEFVGSFAALLDFDL